MVDRQHHPYPSMATSIDAASFSSRRPAANGLPQFQLPAPTEIPSMQKPPAVPSLASSLSQPRSASSVLTPPPGVTTDGISPMSSANTPSSQSSGAMSSYSYAQHGAWPTPGSNSSYTYGSSNPSNQPLSSSYGNRGSVYQPSPSMPYSGSRSSQSPAIGQEGLPPPPYDAQVQNTFSPSQGGSGAGNQPSAVPGQASLPSQGQQPQSAMMSSQSPAQSQPQQQPPASAPSHVDYAHSRPPPTQSYYPPSSTPQQSTFPSYAPPQQSPGHHSPTTSGVGQRSVSAMSQPTGMAPPQPYRPPTYQHQYPAMPQHQMGGPIMSNLTNPGGQMSLVPGMGVPHHGYGQMPPHIYGHPPQAQQERPFKCDQCTQSFNRNHDLKRHRRIHLAVKPFPCTFCEKSFSRKDALKVC